MDKLAKLKKILEKASLVEANPLEVPKELVRIEEELSKQSESIEKSLETLKETIDSVDRRHLEASTRIENSIKYITTLNEQFEAAKDQFKGEQGEPGKNGKDGKDGRNGKDGKDGKDGRDGADGKDGLDGKDGVDGTNADLDGAEIVTRINDLPLEDEFRIDASRIKNLPEPKTKILGGGGTRQVIAGFGVEIDNTNPGFPVISLLGTGTSTFETVSANLGAYDTVLAYDVDGNVQTITYSNGVVKTLSYTDGNVTTIVLSGATPSGITLTKTLTYSNGDVVGITYT